MKLFYFSNERFPSSSACSIQQMRMCEAFANIGIQTFLVRPLYLDCMRYNKKDIFDFYGVEPVFRIFTLPTLLSLSKPAAGKKSRFCIPYIGGLSMQISTWLFILAGWIAGLYHEKTIFYSRNVNASMVFLRYWQFLMKKKQASLCFEVHSLSQQPAHYFKKVLEGSHVLVSISQALKNALVKGYKIDEQKTIVCPDGVQYEQLIEPRFSKNDARIILNLPKEYSRIVVYTGQILPGKGVEYFIRAAKYLDDVLFVIVGGNPISIADVKNKTQCHHQKNVFFSGFVAPRSVSNYQSAADILVLPNTEGSDISQFTSPLKLFEYMAAERPIVASDMPVLREILQHGQNAILVQPADEKELAGAIRRLLHDQNLADQISEQARRQVEQYTWSNRARKIINFIRNKLPDNKITFVNEQ